MHLSIRAERAYRVGLQLKAESFDGEVSVLCMMEPWLMLIKWKGESFTL